MLRSRLKDRYDPAVEALLRDRIAADSETDEDQVLQMVILGKRPDGSYAPGIVSTEDA